MYKFKPKCSNLKLGNTYMAEFVCEWQVVLI